MSTTSQLITAEALFQMPDVKRCELIQGEIINMSQAGSEHGMIVGRITRVLANHVEDASLGIIFGAETGFIIQREPDTVRAPDVAFVRADSIPVTGIPKEFWPGAPDLVVEVLSPDDSIRYVDEKVEMWLAAGTKLAWVVNPKWRTVTVYRSASDIETITEQDTLSGENVVPGFACPVAEMFLPR